MFNLLAQILSTESSVGSVSDEFKVLAVAHMTR